MYPGERLTASATCSRVQPGVRTSSGTASASFSGERSSLSKFSTKATRCASSAFVLRTNVAIVVQVHHPRRAEAPQAACQNVLVTV
jgi:hypothetical protein